MAVDLREGLERIKLEAEQTRRREGSLHQNLEERLQTPLADAPQLSSEIIATDRAHRDTDAQESGALQRQQTEARADRTQSLVSQFAQSARAPTQELAPASETPAQSSDVDRASQDILGKLRRDRERGRDGREPR
jgi:hypothetical protein